MGNLWWEIALRGEVVVVIVPVTTFDGGAAYDFEARRCVKHLAELGLALGEPAKVQFRLR